MGKGALKIMVPSTLHVPPTRRNRPTRQRDEADAPSQEYLATKVTLNSISAYSNSGQALGKRIRGPALRGTLPTNIPTR
jgi:hypothetical protein